MPSSIDLRVVTIATANYRPLLDRLLMSLRRVHPQATVEVYTADTAGFEGLPHPGAEVRVLRHIDTVGVKRAKFAAYRDAIRRGPFVYLDADIVVLGELDELVGPSHLTACADDLGGCAFVSDRTRPWPGAPELVNHRYINSGVMGFGTAMEPHLVELERFVAEDDFWERHIHPDGLFDNHVLCAYLNRVDVPLHLVSERRFNWQGLRRADGSLCASRRGDRLLNDDTGEVLQLVHFAGIRDVDRFLIELPLDVSRLINRASLESAPPERAVCSVGAGDGLADWEGDHHRAIAAKVVSEAFADAWHPDPSWAQERYVEHPDDLVSVALAVPPSDVVWNGLRCGGAYLEPSEYLFVRSVLEALPGHSVLEFGAGETTRLFATIATDIVSLEAFDGPWIDRARTSAAHVVAVELDDAGRIDDSLLRSVLPPAPTVVFVDSPRGTGARVRLLAQVLEHRRPEWVVAHDARRDLAALAGVLMGRDYVIEHTLDSRRGLVVLRRADVAPSGPIGTPDRAGPLAEFAAQITLIGADAPERLDGDVALVRVAVRNRSASWWQTAGAHPVRLAYHVRVGDEIAVFDGDRTPLPCAVGPGDQIECSIAIVVPDGIDDAIVDVTLVQEGVAWFDDVDADQRVELHVVRQRDSS